MTTFLQTLRARLPANSYWPMGLALFMFLLSVYSSHAAQLSFNLTLVKSGNGSGKIMSVPAGIDCGADCTELYPGATQVNLTAGADPGSTFTGWQGLCTGANTTCAVMITTDSRITATFTLNQYSLTITKTGNGTGKVASTPGGIDCGADCSEFYPHGAQVTLSAVADPGATFIGWQGACSGAGQVCTVSMESAKAVTAIFTLNQYTLTVAKAGNGTGRITSTPAGIDCNNDCGELYHHGTLVTLTAVADTSATFAGWSGACSGLTLTCLVTMDGAKQVTAIFILNHYTLSVTKNGTGGGKIVSTPAGIDCGLTCNASYPHGTVITLTATANPGSTFAGWQGNCTNVTGPCVVTMDGAKQVAATFTLNQYTLAVAKTGSSTGKITSTPAGIDCGGACNGVYSYGAVVTLSASADISATFTGWSGACSGVDTICSIPIDAAKRVTATFTLKQYNLLLGKSGNGVGKVVSTPAGIDCGAACSSIYAHSATVTLAATAEASSIFTGWQGACMGVNTSCALTLDGAKAVTATFTLKQYPVSITKSGNGAGSVSSIPAALNCGLTCTVPLNHGVVVTLTATADSSSTFTGWQGACTGVNPLCTVTLNGAKPVTATFTLKKYDLRVTKNGSSSGKVTSTPAGIDCGSLCTINVNHGTPITLTATAAISATFSGWSGACSGLNSACQVTVDAAKAVTATFSIKEYSVFVKKAGNGIGRVLSIPAALDCGLTCTAQLKHGAVLTLTATADAGSTFLGWQGACTGVQSACRVTIDDGKVVTTTFALKQYPLTVVNTGNGAGLIRSQPAGLACGITCTLTLNHGAVVTLTASAALSSTFSGWAGACTGLNPSCVVTMDALKAITASFTLKQYDLTVTPSGNGVGKVVSSPAGIDCGVACRLTLDHGVRMTLTVTTAVSSLFTGWSGACSGEARTCVVAMDSAKQVTATFQLKQYALTVRKTGRGVGRVVSTPAGLDCGITCTVHLGHGTVMTLTPTAGSKSTFGGWTGACSGLGLCTVTVAADQVITATFTGEPVVTLAAAMLVSPAVVTAGQVISYHYWITNTGELSLTLHAVDQKVGPLALTLADGTTPLSPTAYLQPGAAALAARSAIAPRCAADLPLQDALIVTGTTSSGIVTTTQTSITTPVNVSPLLPQLAKTDTVYIGCDLHLAMAVAAAAESASYEMVVIVGPPPSGLTLVGVQTILPYRDHFTLREQTNALLTEGCDPGVSCHTVRRMILEPGADLRIETIDTIAAVYRLFLPLSLK